MLERIAGTKRMEVAVSKEQRPLSELQNRIRGEPPPSLSKALVRPGLNVIAEIKFRSPSHGPFTCQSPPEAIAESYVRNGAAALSILTDETYFGGSLEILQRVCKHLRLKESAVESPHDEFFHGDSAAFVRPLLRKDFILDPYQIVEARAFGASAYLLIVALLEPGELMSLQGRGAEYGLEALVEVHDARDLEIAIESGSRIIGVNNRNLRTFEVDIEVSFEIARRLEGEEGFVLIAESGISEHSQLLELRDAGFSAFLIGTKFMDSRDPGVTLRTLLAREQEAPDEVP